MMSATLITERPSSTVSTILIGESSSFRRLRPGTTESRLCGALFLKRLVQEHLYVSLIRKSLLVREILGSLDIGHREPHGNGLQGNSPPRLAGLQRAFHDLRGRFRMPVPPLGLCSFGAERWNRDLLFGHAHFPSKYICCCGFGILSA